MNTSRLNVVSIFVVLCNAITSCTVRFESVCSIVVKTSSSIKIIVHHFHVHEIPLYRTHPQYKSNHVHCYFSQNQYLVPLERTSKRYLQSHVDSCSFGLTVLLDKNLAKFWPEHATTIRSPVRKTQNILIVHNLLVILTIYATYYLKVNGYILSLKSD